MQVNLSAHAACHAWAHQTQSHAKASALSFTGPRLFSYSTCIAEIVNDADGAPVYLLNDTRYSATTSSKHYPPRNGAIPRGAHIIRLPWGVRQGADALRLNAAEFYDAIPGALNEAAAHYLKSTRARLDWSKAHSLASASEILDALEAYAALFGFEFTRPASFDSLAAEVEKTRKAAITHEKVEKERRAALQAEALQAWRDGGPMGGFYFVDTALRINGDIIETSRGANIPLEHGVKLWPLLSRWKAEGKSYTGAVNGHSIRLGHYAVESFDGDVLRVGCHDIPYSELARIAGLLGLTAPVLAVA